MLAEQAWGSDPHGKTDVVMGSYGKMAGGKAYRPADEHLRLFSDLHTHATWQVHLYVNIHMHTYIMYKYTHIEILKKRK